jgi:hypothetical protein
VTCSWQVASQVNHVEILIRSINRWFPCLTRGHPFSCLAKRKEPKRKRARRDAPRVSRRVSLRYSSSTGAAEFASAAPRLRQSSPFFGCAETFGFPPAPALLGVVQGGGRIPRSMQVAIGVLYPPLWAAEQHRRAGEFGEDCLSPAQPRRVPQPPGPTSSAGKLIRGAAANQPAHRGRLFFRPFLLARQEKGARASGAETSG